MLIDKNIARLKDIPKEEKKEGDEKKIKTFVRF